MEVKKLVRVYGEERRKNVDVELKGANVLMGQ